MREITEFRGPHSFLSNFHRGDPFYLPGWQRLMPTAEHAFQACKARYGEGADWVLEADSPQLAKSRGRQVDAHPDWELIKKRIMLKVLLAKFSDDRLRSLLVSTGDAVLIEGNDWGDTYWGAVRYGARGFDSALPYWHFGVRGPLDCGNDLLAGQNWLGRELMMVREVLA